MSSETAYHHFLIAALVIYAKDGTAKQRYMNMVLHQPSKNIRASTLDTARMNILQRFITEHQLTQEDIQDLVFLTITPLGLMTQSEFTGSKPSSAVRTNPIN